MVVLLYNYHANVSVWVVMWLQLPAPPQASKRTNLLLLLSCVPSRRMLRWCVMWSVAWRTQSLTPPSCSPPWSVCGPTQASRSVSAAPESTSSTIQRSSTYSTCDHMYVCMCHQMNAAAPQEQGRVCHKQRPWIYYQNIFLCPRARCRLGWK